MEAKEMKRAGKLVWNNPYRPSLVAAKEELEMREKELAVLQKRIALLRTAVEQLSKLESK